MEIGFFGENDPSKFWVRETQGEHLEVENKEVLKDSEMHIRKTEVWKRYPNQHAQ